MQRTRYERFVDEFFRQHYPLDCHGDKGSVGTDEESVGILRYLRRPMERPHCGPPAMKLTTESWAAWIVSTLAILIVTAAATLTIYVHHYSHVSSPAGQHCWHEVNSAQPLGIEKVCMWDGAR